MRFRVSKQWVGRGRFELPVSWSQTRRFTELSDRPSESDSTRQALQRARLQHGAHGARPMTVQALLLRRHLAKRLPGSGHEKNGVVAEARLAPPLGHDLAATFPLEALGPPPPRRQRPYTHASRDPAPRP